MGSHDKLFKRVFSNPKNAITHFQAFLPDEIISALDLSGASLVPGSWVDEGLREHHSDVLYAIPTRSAPGSADSTKDPRIPPTLLYVLFEHQRSVNPQMALKLLRYGTRALDQWSREHPGHKLPPLISLVLFHGETRWTAARKLEDLFDLSGFDGPAIERLRQFLPKIEYLVDEITLVPDEHLPGRGVVRLTMLVFKHGGRPDLMDLLQGWEDEFRFEVSQGTSGLQNLAEIVEYLLRVNEQISVEALAEFMSFLGHKAKEIPMTVGQQLIEKGLKEGFQKGWLEGRQEGIQEGIQKGIQKGIQEGRQEGIQEGRLEGRQNGILEGRQNGILEGKIETARRALARGLPPKEVSEITGLPLEEVQKLVH